MSNRLCVFVDTGGGSGHFHFRGIPGEALSHLHAKGAAF